MGSLPSEGQFVTFSLGAETFAVPVTVVREILDHEDAFHLPDGPHYLLGLRDVRGQGVPVIDLRLRLGLPASDVTPHTRVLVLDIPLAGRLLTLGMMADRVHEVVSFRAGEIEPPPDIGRNWRSEHITGVARRGSGFVVLLDLASLLGEGDLAMLPDAAA
ncbi:MAG: chemotaxis protein CheW [Rubellimicrobium sp.]|nr:chemotaxis protein CheW [Rubellimicrobium sp.]